MPSLLSPIRIGSLELSARLFKAATMEGMADPNGRVSDQMLEFYAHFARAGTPLVVTGSFYVAPEGAVAPATCGIDDDDKIAGVRRLVEVVHRPQSGAHLFVQLNHGGRQVVRAGNSTGTGMPILSASAIADPILWNKVRAMDEEEVAATVEAFASAAARCAESGCDGVELHAGHGFLISQFLSPHTNRRRDQYGGSLRRRARLFTDIVAAIKQRVGVDFPVTAKMNGADLLPGRRGLTSDALAEVARLAQEEGLDAVTVTVGHYESGLSMLRGQMRPMVRGLVDGGLGRDFHPLLKLGIRAATPTVAALGYLLWRRREAFNLRYAAPFKERLHIPVVSVGGFADPAVMEAAIASGRCDAVASARGLLANPYLLRHIRAGVDPGPECDFCNACSGMLIGTHTSCHNPGMSRRRQAMLEAEAVL